MPNTAARLQPVSRTEISMRVKGIIAEVFSCGVSRVDERLRVKDVGLPAFALGRRSAVFVTVVIDRVERAFEVRLEDAHSNTFREIATVGELISLVEGALSQGGIRG